MEKKENEQEEPENEAQVQDELVEEQIDGSEERPEKGEEEENEGADVDELAELKDRHLRLYSEFENFRRRTAREKLDVISTANADLMVSLLPVLDDFERGMNAMQETGIDKDVSEGLNLVYTKFRKTLEQNGLKEIDAGKGTAFDVEIHEAISQIPAPSKKLKGKIIDVVEKGYFLKEKVIRFAKVVVGS